VATEVSSPVELKPTMSFHRKSHRDSKLPRRHWPADESQFFPEWGYGQTGLKAREY
jgi:hypothetical protein